jgi:hypothetical protein
VFEVLLFLPLILVGIIVFAVVGLVIGVLGLLGHLIALPFRLLGFFLHLAFGLLFLVSLFLLPLLPFVLLAAGIVWLIRRSGRRAIPV